MQILSILIANEKETYFLRQKKTRYNFVFSFQFLIPILGSEPLNF